MRAATAVGAGRAGSRAGQVVPGGGERRHGLLVGGAIGECRNVGLLVLRMYVKRVRMTRMCMRGLRQHQKRGHKGHGAEQLRAQCPHRHAPSLAQGGLRGDLNFS